jgi:cytochrome P450
LLDPDFSNAMRYRRLFAGLTSDPAHDASRFQSLTGQRLGTLDPPEHTRMRRALAPALAKDVVVALRPRVQRLARALVRRVYSRGSMDLVEEFALPLPLLVMMEALGIPFDRWEQTSDWTRAQVEFLADGDRSPDRAALADRAQAAIDAYEEMLRAIVDQPNLADAAPDAIIMHALVRLRDRDGSLAHDQLVSGSMNLLTAGHMPVSNFISGGVLALLAELPFGDDVPAALQGSRSAVDEVARFVSPGRHIARTASRDTLLAGVAISAGDPVRIALGAANRDPAMFSDPDRLDLHRTPNPHVAFGRGIHGCLGARIALMEAQVAFQTLFSELPALHLVDAEVELLPGDGQRSIASLPVRWGVPRSPGRGRA